MHYEMPASIRLDTVMFCLKKAEQAFLLGHASIDFDFSACTDYDSSALSLILCLKRKASSLGLACRFLGLAHSLIRVAEVYGVAPMIST